MAQSNTSTGLRPVAARRGETTKVAWLARKGGE